MGKAERRFRRNKEESRTVENLTESDQFALTVMMHFPGIEPGNVEALSCDGCEDYRVGVCPGGGLEGEKVLECMLVHSQDTISWGMIDGRTTVH